MADGPWGTCIRCGYKRRLATFRTEWTGKKVCADCYEPRNKQELVKGIADRQAIQGARPEPTATFRDPEDFLASDL